MADLTLADRVAKYGYAVLGSWWGILSVLLGLVRLSPTLVPRLQPIADAMQKERRVLVAVAATMFVVANFQIYDQARREVRMASSKPPTINWRALPRSPDGLRPGELWNNGGMPAIVE